MSQSEWNGVLDEILWVDEAVKFGFWYTRNLEINSTHSDECCLKHSSGSCHSFGIIYRVWFSHVYFLSVGTFQNGADIQPIMQTRFQHRNITKSNNKKSFFVLLIGRSHPFWMVVWQFLMFNDCSLFSEMVWRLISKINAPISRKKFQLTSKWHSFIFIPKVRFNSIWTQRPISIVHTLIEFVQCDYGIEYHR